MRAKLLHTLFLLSVASALPVAAAEPLPKGATQRLGSTQLRDGSGWANATLSPDGNDFILQTNRGTQKLSLKTGEPNGTIGEKNAILGRQIRFSADSSRVLSIAYSDVSVWDAASGKTLASVKRALPFGDGAASLTADGKLFAVGGSQDSNAKDKPVTALVWDVEKNAKIAEVPALQNQSVMVALSSDGKTLATWGTHFERNPPKDGVEPANDPNRIVQIWDVAGSKETVKLRLEGYGSPIAAFSPDAQTLAISSGNGLVRLLDPKTGEERRRLFGRSDSGTRLAFSPDGKTLAVGGTDCTVQLWNTADGARRESIECPAGTLNFGLRGIAFTANDRAVAWTAIGFAALAWELPSGKLLTPLSGHVAAIRSIAFADNNEILTGSDDGQILRWSTDGKTTGETRLRLPGGFNSVTRYSMMQNSLTTDGKFAMSQQALYEAATGKQIASLQSGIGLDARTYLCSDGRTILMVPLVAYPPKPTIKSVKITAWDLQTGSRLAELEVPPSELVHAVRTPDGSRLVTVTTTRTEMKTEFHVTAWELKTSAKLGSYSEAGGFGNFYLAAAPDNNAVVVSVPSGKLLAINLADGKVLKELDTGRRNISAHPAFTPDGKQIAAAVSVGFGPNAGAEIILFDWESGAAAGKFRGHTGAVTAMTYSKDGKTLATGSADTSVLLWNPTLAEK